MAYVVMKDGGGVECGWSHDTFGVVAVITSTDVAAFGRVMSKCGHSIDDFEVVHTPTQDQFAELMDDIQASAVVDADVPVMIATLRDKEIGFVSDIYLVFQVLTE